MATDPNAIAPVETVAPISNTPYAPVMTPTQATSLVNQYGINPTQVLSNQNIQQTTTNPAPNPDDLLGIRADIYNTQGVNTAQAAYQQAMGAASSAALGLNERLTGLRGRAVSLSKITGTQAQERAVSQGEIDALNESARIAQSDYIAKKGNADEMFQIRNQEISEKKEIMLKYPGAGVTFTDSFDSVSKKLTAYQDKVARKEWKDELKKVAMSLGISYKGLSHNEIEAKISKVNKSTLNMAKEEHNLKMESMRMDIANTKSTIANRGKTTKTSAQEKQENLSDASNLMQSNAGGDGYVSPQTYGAAKSAWIGSGSGSAAEFDANFQQYINPSDPQDYSITKTSSQLLGTND